MRARQLGVISARQNTYLWTQLTKVGYKMREPAGLDPPDEPPRKIQEIVTFHLNNLGYSWEELLRVLRTTDHDLRFLCGRNRPLLTLVN